MPTYDQDLLAASRQLLAREPGTRGRLSSARIRRSISTTYYALFHFLLDQCAIRSVGAGGELRRSRRVFSRVFTHAGVRIALEKVRSQSVHATVQDFFERTDGAAGPYHSPAFAREMYGAFLQAQDQRHAADYDLNSTLSETDAYLLIDRVMAAIEEWKRARSQINQDFKDALCLLIVLGGKLRTDRT